MHKLDFYILGFDGFLRWIEKIRTTVSMHILRRRSNFRKGFLGAFLFKFEESAVIIKMPF